MQSLQLKSESFAFSDQVICCEVNFATSMITSDAILTGGIISIFIDLIYESRLVKIENYEFKISVTDNIENLLLYTNMTFELYYFK